MGPILLKTNVKRAADHQEQASRVLVKDLFDRWAVPI